MLFQVPFTNVSASEIGFTEENGNEEIVYYDNDTDSVTIDQENSGEKEYQLEVENNDENVTIEVIRFHY